MRELRDALDMASGKKPHAFGGFGSKELVDDILKLADLYKKDELTKDEFKKRVHRLLYTKTNE